MFNRIHQKLGTAGFIISIVALVAALGGGAYAASGGLNGKQKKEVEKIAKTYAGKPGANGTNGSNGAAGAKGDAGAAGSNGSNGSSVTTANIPTSSATCNHNGGVEVKSAGAPVPVCNGEEGEEGLPGQTGFTSTLPAGKTETGRWGTGGTFTAGDFVYLPVSFPIPLAAPLSGESHVRAVVAGKERVFNEANFSFELVPATQCLGSEESPKASPGNLCLYVGFQQGLSQSTDGFPNGILETVEGEEIGTLPSGAILRFQKEGTGYAQVTGSFAVTAP